MHHVLVCLQNAPTDIFNATVHIYFLNFQSSPFGGILQQSRHVLFYVWVKSSTTAILPLLLISNFCLINAADSAHESTESDDEFQICEICSSEEVIPFDMLRLF